jgi:hypothetical protein
MSVWDKFKELLGSFNLFSIKELLKVGSIKFGGQTINIKLPDGVDIEKVLEKVITPELEDKYIAEFRKNVEAKESHIATLPDDRQYEILANSSVATALSVMVYDDVRVMDDVNSSIGEGSDVMTTIPFRKKPFSGSDFDNGEGM